METLASLYPPLAERTPVPTLYQPLIFVLSLTPFFFCRRHRAALITFPLIFALCTRAPFYTFGNESADYYSASFFIALPLWFVEFAILTPAQGPEESVYVGNRIEPWREKGNGKRWEDLRSYCERIFWASSLMVPSHRGIGWSWQVKNVHPGPDQSLHGTAYMRKHLMIAVCAYARSMSMLVLLGWSSTIQRRLPSDRSILYYILNSLIGWSGAIWVWDRLNCFYSIMAAISVALGVCENWQWPPLMGHLQDAWSVRQMWSLVYHQTMRKVPSP